MKLHVPLIALLAFFWSAELVAQPPAPEALTASDGTYDDYVLVRWDARAGVDGYKVFRRAHPDHGSFQEITKEWRKSTWLCDYGAQPGVTYYYTVVGTRAGSQSDMAVYDAGFVAKNKYVIGGEGITAADDLYADPPRYLLAVADAAATAAAYRPGRAVTLRYQLTNPYEADIGDTEIMFVLSRDENYGWDDRKLLERAKTYADFPARGELAMKETLRLPNDVRPGNYFILIVNARKGDLSRIEVTPVPLRVE